MQTIWLHQSVQLYIVRLLASFKKEVHIFSQLYSLHRKATPLPGQKPSQLLALETCWALMSSESQLPCELVPIFSKARNAAVGSLLTGWGFTASPALKMQAASRTLSHKLHPQTITDPHWSPLCPWARWPDEK